MEKRLIYLDTYILQQDMRVRLPKAILANMDVEKGKSYFDIFFDTEKKQLLLIPSENEMTKEESK